jgi:hypothetical protein
MGNANSGARVHKRKYKGQAHRTALALFGRKSLMETPEERETLALVLRLSDKPAFQHLAAQAMSPLQADRSTSFAMLIEKHGLNIHSIAEEFKAIQRSTGFMRAAQHLPDIMEETAQAARSHDERCKKCKGTGQVKEIACDNCDGTGKVHVPGDLERLKITLETFELLGKRAGLNLNLDLRKLPEHESMADLSASIAPLLEGQVK